MALYLHFYHSLVVYFKSVKFIVSLVFLREFREILSDRKSGVLPKAAQQKKARIKIKRICQKLIFSPLLFCSTFFDEICDNNEKSNDDNSSNNLTITANANKNKTYNLTVGYYENITWLFAEYQKLFT